MSNFNGGYTLNRKGLRDSEEGAAAWGRAAKAAFAAGEDVPDRNAYVPEYFETDEDFQTFYEDCESEFNPDKAAAQRDSEKIDWTDPRAVAEFANEHDGNIEAWLQWLVDAYWHNDGLTAFTQEKLQRAADNYAAWHSPTTGKMGYMLKHEKGIGWTMKAKDTDETWLHDRGATAREAIYVAAVAIAITD